MILKVFCKIFVLFRLFQSLEILELAMVREEKVNIVVTYCGLIDSRQNDTPPTIVLYSNIRQWEILGE